MPAKRVAKSVHARTHFDSAGLLAQADQYDSHSVRLRDQAADLLSKSVEMSKAAADLRTRALPFSVATKVRSRTDISTWFIAVADRGNIGWETKLSLIQPGAGDVVQTLCLECDAYARFEQDGLTLQKSDRGVSAATTVGAFVTCIDNWYIDHGWTVS